MIVKEENVEITGMYGDIWKKEDFQKITLLEEMPKIISKENGFGTDMISKCHFYVASYGSSLSPYILIQTNDKPIFINGNNPDQTHIWYEQLKKEIK